MLSSLLSTGHVQTLDKAKLDQLFDRLLEKNKGWVASPPLEATAESTFKLTIKRPGGDMLFTKGE